MVTKEVFSAAEDAYLAWTLNGGTSRDGLRAALEAVMPMVRNATLEEAAKVAENLGHIQVDAGEPAEGKVFSGVTTIDNMPTRTELASAIRALATQSPPPFLTTGERKE